MECDITTRGRKCRGICRFSYSLDNGPALHIRTRGTASEPKWIGAKLGFFSITPRRDSRPGWMDITDIEIK